MSILISLRRHYPEQVQWVWSQPVIIKAPLILIKVTNYSIFVVWNYDDFGKQFWWPKSPVCYALHHQHNSTLVFSILVLFYLLKNCLWFFNSIYSIFVRNVSVSYYWYYYIILFCLFLVGLERIINYHHPSLIVGTNYNGLHYLLLLTFHTKEFQDGIVSIHQIHKD